MISPPTHTAGLLWLHSNTQHDGPSAGFPSAAFTHISGSDRVE